MTSAGCTTNDLPNSFKRGFSRDNWVADDVGRAGLACYGRTLSDASMLYFADVFFIGFCFFLWPP